MENTNIVFIDYSAKNKSSVSVEAQNLFMNYITVFQNGVEFEVGHALLILPALNMKRLTNYLKRYIRTNRYRLVLFML
ncbi:DUF5067 domain-containing protein [Enterococcus faecium]|nr:DUF5067 domain-containing protein [Enterococcus faecium]